MIAITIKINHGCSVHSSKSMIHGRILSWRHILLSLTLDISLCHIFSYFVMVGFKAICHVIVHIIVKVTLFVKNTCDWLELKRVAGGFEGTARRRVPLQIIVIRIIIIIDFLSSSYCRDGRHNDHLDRHHLVDHHHH